MPYNKKKAGEVFSGMGRKEMQSLFSLITAAVFFTAAFFTGRQAAVLTGKFRVEREQSRQSRTKYCVVVDAGHGGCR